MAKSFNRHFQFVGSSKNVQSGRLWLPAADVYQTDEGWLVKVELAGVSAEDIEIDIRGIRFTLQAVARTARVRSVRHITRWRSRTAALKRR